MQTRSSSKFVSESSSNPIFTDSKHRNRIRSKPRVEPFSIPIVTMADNRTMEEVLQAPTEGYGDAIVVLDILAENFEIKTVLLSLIQANQFHGFKSNNPHDHIRSFNRITPTLTFRFMNYLEEQTDGEAMINSIKNGDQPLPRVTQVSIAGTTSTEQPPLKDKSIWFDQEKRVHKIDHLARSLLIQGLPNDIYSLIDSNKTAKDLDVNDAMGSKKKTIVVTSYPLALIAEKMKKITTLLAKAFNRRKFYSKPTNNNLRTSSTSQSANKKQEFVKSDDKNVKKKADDKKSDMSRVKCYNCKKEGHFAKDCKKAKVKDYEYYKTKMLLAKKDKDEQVLLAEDQAWMESSSDSDQEIKANMVFMAQIEKVLSDSEASSS
nr:reverse transcriptase domain-containing protein [Tanacetum cinerariifolium]